MLPCSFDQWYSIGHCRLIVIMGAVGIIVLEGTSDAVDEQSNQTKSVSTSQQQKYRMSPHKNEQIALAHTCAQFSASEK